LAIDIGKSLKVATIPIAILVALGILQNVIGLVPFLGGVAICLTGPLFLIATLVVLGWAGYKAVKEAQMDLVGGAVTGAIAGVISGAIGAVVGFVFALLGVGADVAGGGGAEGAAYGAVGSVIGLVFALVFGIIFGAVIGAIMGAAGAFVAGMGTKGAPAAPAAAKK
jgi:hypothetical protein